MTDISVRACFSIYIIFNFLCWWLHNTPAFYQFFFYA